MDLQKNFLDFLSNKIGSPIDYNLISSTNNYVYLLKTDRGVYVLKVYANKGVHHDIENFVRKTIGDSNFFRPLIFADDSQELFPFSFTLFTYIEGKTLRQLIQSGEIKLYDLPGIAKQIADFIKIISSYEMNGCGYLKPDGTSSHESWLIFLFDYQTKTVVDLLNASIDPWYCRELYAFLVNNFASFQAINKFFLIPIDLNFDNFLITSDGKVVALDVGGVASGPLLFSLGEFVGHSYTTQLCSDFLSNFSLTPEEKKSVHFYAMLMNMNVLAFIARYKLSPLNEAKPWGNQTTFLDLIEQNYQICRG